MTEPTLLEVLSSLSIAGEELLDPQRLTGEDFDIHLEQFITAVEAMLPKLSANLSSEESTAVSRFAEIHNRVIALTVSTRSEIAARLKALERNRPALLKYWVQKKK